MKREGNGTGTLWKAAAWPWKRWPSPISMVTVDRISSPRAARPAMSAFTGMRESRKNETGPFSGDSEYRASFRSEPRSALLAPFISLTIRIKCRLFPKPRRTYQMKQRLLTPGPTPVPEETLLELAKPVVYHRTAESRQVMLDVLQGLQHVFQTRQSAIPLTSSGTGGLEAAIVNTLPPKTKALCRIARRV